MAYTLQALLLKGGVDTLISSPGLEHIPLFEGLYLVPFTFEYLQFRKLPFLPLTDGGEQQIGKELEQICARFCADGKGAYVEAEYFGGEGVQASVLFEDGRVVEEARLNAEAINSALAWLGIVRTVTQDEFEVAGLDRERNTEAWIDNQG